MLCKEYRLKKSNKFTFGFGASVVLPGLPELVELPELSFII
jgi:hypothetical protein